MRRRVFIGLGAASIGAGVLHSTGAFSTISAGRGISINATSDETALVALDIADEVRSNRDGERLVTISNNFDENLDVTVELTGQAAQDGTISLVDGVLSLTPGGSDDVLVNLDQANPATGEITFEISADTGSASVVLTRGGVVVTNPGGGGGGGTGEASFIASDLQFEGETFTQEFSFDVDALRNNDEARINLSDAQMSSGADYSDAVVVPTSGQNQADFEFDQSVPEIRYTARGNVSGIFTIFVENVAPDGDVDGTAFYDDDVGRTDEDTFSVPAVATGGNLDSTGDVIIPDDGTAGVVSAGGSLEMGERSTINNGANVGGDVIARTDVTINGQFSSDGDVTLGDGSAVNNGLSGGGDVTTGSNVTINGPFSSGGAVTLGDDSTVNNGISADGDVTTGTNVTINGQFNSGGTITLGSGTIVNNGLQADGDLILGNNVTVWGAIDVGGTVFEGCNVTYDDNTDTIDSC